MSNFNIIPVIDILNSMPVHAVKGERSKYKPLKSVLFDTINPKKIVEILISIGFRKIYIADLDAIIKNKPNLNLLEEIATIPKANILLDPGIRTEKDFLKYSQIDILKLIIGLETIKDLSIIIKIFNKTKKNRIIISVDMYQQKIKSRNPLINKSTPLEIIKRLKNLGIDQIILLDLFRVGQKAGGIPKLYLEIKNKFGGDVFVGGGIRDINDIKKYQKEKFAGVLIGTALYDGTINFKELTL